MLVARAERYMAKTPKSKGKIDFSYIASTGKLTGREAKAKKRLDALIASHVGNGMTEAEARERAISEMRDNPTQDWRKG
jgi:hypothetical protein